MSGSVSRASIAILFATFVVSGCDRAEREDGWFGTDEGRVVNSSPGDARVDANGMLEFEVTSDLYRRWVLAQGALASSPVARSVAQLGRRALTQADVDGAINRVQRDATASAAVRNAGLSPADYVFATISLEQAMAVAKGNFTTRNEAAASAAATRNAEIARQYEEDQRRAGAATDTMLMPPGQYEPYPPAPTPEPQPVPQPLPQPLPQPVPQPLPQPLPQPRPTPQPIPAPPPSQPVPIPTEPQPRPTEPVEASGARLPSTKPVRLV
ncbi:MAG: hypothetical protein H0X64_02195 [Gemmatimonadaceae bacterium]|nr:hypothetical protein [Gemmatimonadaceae bacterium]